MDLLGMTQMKNTELEKSNMHYIEYIPGTVARVIDTPALIPARSNQRQCESEDVNRLSRIVTKFNFWLSTGGWWQPVEQRNMQLRSIILTQ